MLSVFIYKLLAQVCKTIEKLPPPLKKEASRSEAKSEVPGMVYKCTGSI